ncbi:hypothetical protein [Lactobacillus sp. LL6]|uniref:hypothetical protein n=1 Tax=Lactobacillus sp. LL6 TaxID=2596827 RepID=UPI001186E4CC|nr:hypothetical protein [Lactobacillus sp. LL6]TSO26041.1 hypothetical protein FOD82_02925 [Lactobacillus sp. LL6]
MKYLRKNNLQNWLEKLWPYFAILIAIYLLMKIQLSNHRVVLDIDTMFHYNRFYDIVEQFRTGKFSYFQSNFGFQQSGRIINALYGPLFAYLNGFLVYVLGSWYNYQLASYFIIGIIGGFGMYLLAQKCQANKIISTMIAILYINIGGIQTWFDHTNLMAWGAAFAPFVFIEGVNMLQNKDHPVRWVRLMLIMSIIAQTHLLSTILFTIALIPFVVISWINSPYKKELLINLLKAVLGTLCLTANVWGSLLLILKTNNISPTLSHQLAINALTISDCGTLRNTISKITLILVLIQIIYACLTWKKSKINFIVSIEGGLFLLLSSAIIPWKIVQAKAEFLTNYLQFPHRLLIAAYPLILLGIAISVTELSDGSLVKKLALCFVGLVIIENYAANYARIVQRTTFNHRAVYEVKSKKYFTGKNMYKQEKYYDFVYGLHGKYQANGVKDTNQGNLYVKVATRGDYYKNTLDLTKVWHLTHDANQKGELFNTIIKVNPDYLPTYHKKMTGSLVDYYYIKDVIDPYLTHKFSYRVLNNGRLELKWNSESTKKITLPIIMYKQSRLVLNKKVVSPQLSYIGNPRIKQKYGENIAILQFISPIWFTILFMLTVVSWILLVSYGIIKILRNERVIS